MKNILLIIILMVSGCVTMEKDRVSISDCPMINTGSDLNKTSPINGPYDITIQIHQPSSEDDRNEYINCLELPQLIRFNVSLQSYGNLSVENKFLSALNQLDKIKTHLPQSYAIQSNNFFLISSVVFGLFIDSFEGDNEQNSIILDFKVLNGLMYEKQNAFVDLYGKLMVDPEIKKFYNEDRPYFFKLCSLENVTAFLYFSENITRLKQWKVLCQLNVVDKSYAINTFFSKNSMIEVLETLLKNLEDENFLNNLKPQKNLEKFLMLLFEYQNIDLLNFFLQKDINLEYFNLIEDNWDFMAVADHVMTVQGRIEMKRAFDYIIQNKHSAFGLNLQENSLFVLKSVISRNFPLMEFILTMNHEDWFFFNNFFMNCQNKSLLQSTILYKNNDLLEEILQEHKKTFQYLNQDGDQLVQENTNVYKILFNSDLKQCYFWVKERNGLAIFKQLVLAKIDYQTMGSFLEYTDGQSIVKQLINYFNTEIIGDMDKTIEEINQCLKFLSMFFFNISKFSNFHQFKVYLTQFDLNKAKTMALMCLDLRLIKGFNLEPLKACLSVHNSSQNTPIEELNQKFIFQFRYKSIEIYKKKNNNILDQFLVKQNEWYEAYDLSCSLWHKLGSINGVWTEILKNIQTTKNYSFLNNIKRLFEMTQSPMVWNYLLEDNPEFLLMVMGKYNVGNFIEKFLTKDENGHRKKIFNDFMALLIEEFKSNPNKREEVSSNILLMAPWVDPISGQNKKNQYHEVFFDGLFGLNDGDFIEQILAGGFKSLQRFSLVFFLMGSTFNQHSTKKSLSVFKFYKKNMKDFLNNNNCHGLKYFFSQILEDDNKYNWILKNSHENIGWILNLENTVMNYCFENMEKILWMVKGAEKINDMTMEESVNFNDQAKGWNRFYTCLIEVFGNQSDHFFFSFFDVVFSSDLIADKIFEITKSYVGKGFNSQSQGDNPMGFQSIEENLKKELMDQNFNYQLYQSRVKPQEDPLYNKNLEDQLMAEDFTPHNIVPLTIDHNYDFDSAFRQEAQKKSSFIDEIFYNHQTFKRQSNDLQYFDPKSYDFAFQEIVAHILEDEKKTLVSQSQLKVFTILPINDDDSDVETLNNLIESYGDGDNSSETESDDDMDNNKNEDGKSQGSIPNNINNNEQKIQENIPTNINTNAHQQTNHGTLENSMGGGMMISSGYNGATPSNILNPPITSELKKRKASRILKEPSLKRNETDTGYQLLNLVNEIKDNHNKPMTRETIELVKQIIASVKDKQNDSEIIISPVDLDKINSAIEAMEVAMINFKLENHTKQMESINRKKESAMEKIKKESQDGTISPAEFYLKEEQLLEIILDERLELLNETNEIFLGNIPYITQDSIYKTLDPSIHLIYENFADFGLCNMKRTKSIDFVMENFHQTLKVLKEKLQSQQQKPQNSKKIAIELFQNELKENRKLKNFVIAYNFVQQLKEIDTLQGNPEKKDVLTKNDQLATKAVEQDKKDLDKYEAIQGQDTNLGDKSDKVPETLKTNDDRDSVLLLVESFKKNHELSTQAMEQAEKDLEEYLNEEIQEKEKIDLGWTNLAEKADKVQKILKTAKDSMVFLFQKQGKRVNSHLVLGAFYKQELNTDNFFQPQTMSYLKESKILEKKKMQSFVKHIDNLLTEIFNGLLTVKIESMILQIILNHEGLQRELAMARVIKTIQYNRSIVALSAQDTRYSLELFIIRKIILNLRNLKKTNVEYKKMLDMLDKEFHVLLQSFSVK